MKKIYEEPQAEFYHVRQNDILTLSTDQNAQGGDDAPSRFPVDDDLEN